MGDCGMLTEKGGEVAGYLEVVLMGTTARTAGWGGPSLNVDHSTKPLYDRPSSATPCSAEYHGCTEDHEKEAQRATVSFHRTSPWSIVVTSSRISQVTNSRPCAYNKYP